MEYTCSMTTSSNEKVKSNKLTGPCCPKRKSHMKRFISFLLLGWLCLSLVACGVDAPNGPQNEIVTANSGDPPPPPPPPVGGGGG